jgi:parallel beta-helix repeat protein
VNCAARALMLAIMLSAPVGALLLAPGAWGGPAARDPPSSGDWVVSTPESYSGQNILLAGNLTVAQGGSLSLSNVKLKLASPADGAFHIEVQAGGEILATDRDGVPTPLDDATVFSSGSSFAYQFWVRPGGRLIMRNCVVQDCGFSLGQRGESAGVYLQSGNCEISNTTFKNNYCGIAVDGCAPRLDNCTFLDNRKYGMEVRDTVITVARNLFDQNTVNGLNVTGCDIRLERNNIRGNYRYGINATGSTLALEGNIFQLNRWRALYAESSTVTLHRDEFYQNGYQNNGLACMLKGSRLDMEGAYFEDNPYSLHCEDSRVVMRNTTMINSTLCDIWLTKTVDHSEVVSYNCTFRKAGFNDPASWLEARWNMLLDVAWESTGGPVKGATVRFFDRLGNNLFNLTSNDTGALEPLVMTQYRENRSGRAEPSPFRLLYNRDIRVNRTFITLDRDIRQTLYLDDVPPYFKVTSPKENFTTNHSWINVTGIFNATWKNLTVDGLVVEPGANRTFGNFSVRVNLTEGANVINLTAIDDFYNTYSVLRTIRRDSTPPPLSVDIPEAGLLLNRTTYIVTGTTDPVSYMYVNGLVPTIREDGSFSSLVELAEGANEVVVSSSDQYLNRIQVNRTILVDTVAPFIDFTSPRFVPMRSPQPPPAAGELWTNKPLLRLLGNIEAGSELFFGDESLSPSGTNITLSVNLTEGENLLQFRVRDSAGNWNSTKLLVHLDTVPPSATILFPPEGTPLRSPQVAVRGTTEAGVSVSSRDGAVTQEGTDFWVECNLTPGPNFIALELRDLAGNARKLVINVTLDMDASIRLTGPANYTTVDGGSVRVEGYAEAGATVWVNGRIVMPGPDGHFSVYAPIVLGPNIIDINVSDSAGNSGTYQVVVFRSEPVIADNGGMVLAAAVVAVSAAAASIGAGAWTLRRRRAARARAAVPARKVMAWEEGFERPILRAYEGPEEGLRCARCLMPVSGEWVSCHGCGAPADLPTVSSETFARLAGTEFQTDRERGLKAALLEVRSDISTIMEAGQQVQVQLREATVAAQMLLGGRRPDLVARKTAELGSELGPLSDRLGAAHAREVAQTRKQAHARLKALLEEVDGALPYLRDSGADVRDIDRGVEMTRIHLRADNLEKAYEFMIQAKARKDELSGRRQ